MPAERGILGRRAIERAPCEDARMLIRRDGAARERLVGIAAGWKVDGDETVEAARIGRSGHAVVAFRRALIAVRLLGPDGIPADGDAHHEHRPRIATRHEQMLALADQDVRDARAVDLGREGGRGVEARGRAGDGRYRRRRRTGGEPQDAQQRGGGRQQAAILALALLLASARASAAAPSGAQALDLYAALRAPVGSTQTDFVLAHDTLLDVAARNHVGFEAVSRLNPGLDPWIPDPGTIVRLPTRYLLPRTVPAGLVVNIPEMRAYDFGVEAGPEVLAVAIGDADDPTPIGEYRVGKKRIDPEWRVPASIRADKPELPAVVPAGPDNPLGSRWLTIGTSSYGLHGTNVRWSIGRIATHGCVRFYEEDIVRLYDRVREGTRLQLVYQPYKWGRDGNQLLLEAHPDVYGRIPDPLEAALETPRALGFADRVDVAAVRSVIERADGVPTVVGTLPPRAEIAPTGLLRDPLLEDRFGLAGRVRGVLSGAARVRRGLLGGGGAALRVARSGFGTRDALIERIETAIDLLHVPIRRAARQCEHQRSPHAGENSSSHRKSLLG